MAQFSTTSFSDTTEQVVTTVASYLKGVFVDNPAFTATEGWISLYDASGVTPGTTEPDIVLYCPWGTAMNRSTMRWTFPRTPFATGIEVFYSDTEPLHASAWNAGSGFRLEVYYEVYGA